MKYNRGITSEAVSFAISWLCEHGQEYAEAYAAGFAGKNWEDTIWYEDGNFLDDLISALDLWTAQDPNEYYWALCVAITENPKCVTDLKNPKKKDKARTYLF